MISHSSTYWALALLAMTAVLSSCTSTVRTMVTTPKAPAPLGAEVVILNDRPGAEQECTSLATTRVFDGGLATSCSYEMGMESIRLEARKVGGNTAVITQHRPPTVWTTCHQFEAELLYCRAPIQKIERVDSPSTSMPDTTRTSYVPSDLENDSQSQQQSQEKLLPPSKKTPLPSLRLAVHGGLSRVRGRIPDDFDPVLKNHLTELRSGQHIGGSILFKISRTSYLGASFSQFTTIHDSGDFIIEFPDGTTVLTGFSSDTQNTFFGPTFGTLGISNNGQWELATTISAGVNTHVSKEEFIGKRELSASSFALDTRLEAGYLLSDELTFGIGLGIYTSSFSSFTVSEGGQTRKETLNDPESASRWDFSVGLRWYPGRSKLIARMMSEGL